MKKKICSWILVLCMVLSLAPMVALADDVPAAAEQPGDMTQETAPEDPAAPEAGTGDAKAPAQSGEAGEADEADETGETGETGEADEADETGETGEADEAGETGETGEADEADEADEAGEAGEAAAPEDVEPMPLQLDGDGETVTYTVTGLTPEHCEFAVDDELSSVFKPGDRVEFFINVNQDVDFVFERYKLKSVTYSYEENGETVTKEPTLITSQTDSCFWYEFSMPAADVTVKVETEIVTFPISFDFGAEHAGFVQKYWGDTTSIEIDGQKVPVEINGAVVTVEVPYGASIREGWESLLNSAGGIDPNDNGQQLQLDHNHQYCIGAAPPAYKDETDYDIQNQGKDAMLNDRQPPYATHLYVQWADPVEAVITVTPPQCGTVVKYDWKTGIYVWSVPQPEMTVSEHIALSRTINYSSIPGI